jgi:hypothetical protein
VGLVAGRRPATVIAEPEILRLLLWGSDCATSMSLSYPTPRHYILAKKAGYPVRFTYS